MTPDQATPADVWRQTMRQARALNPDKIAAYIAEGSDTGLRASRYDAQGGRTTRVPCENPSRCHDGPDDHSHLVVSDPTGNTATRERRPDGSVDDLPRLAAALADFVDGAGVVLEWVCGKRPATWVDVLTVNAKLMPGTVQAGLDVDHARRLPPAIDRTSRAVDAVASLAREYVPRAATQDEQHWTAGLADEDCCAWHLAVHRRYRRPRVVHIGGVPVCADCLALYDLGESTRPPTWVIEAEVDRLSKPRAWHAALGRWLDELGIERDRSA